MAYSVSSGPGQEAIDNFNSLKQILLQAKLMKMHLAIISRADLKEEDVEDD